MRDLTGLSAPETAVWERVRIAQLSELVRRMPVICAANLVVGAALLGLLWGMVPHLHLIAWGGALLSVVGLMAHHYLRLRYELKPGHATRAIREATVHAVALGALWSMPAAMFADGAPLNQQLAICLLTASIMASGTLASATLPSAVIGFITLSGFGLTEMMIATGSPLLASAPLIYAGCLAIGGLANAQSFIRRMLAEAELGEKSELVSLLLREFEDNGADWLWQVDVAKTLRQVSSRLSRAAGRPATELEGLPLLQLLAGDAWKTAELAPELNELIERMNARESFSDLHVPVVLPDEIRWWCLSAAPRFDERGSFVGFHGVGSDVTEQKRSQEKIAQMARFDALTGLPNRVQLLEEARESLARAFRERGRCALMLIDLDKFKPVNDTLGHPIGDQLLKLVAERLRGLLGEGDTCGRLGGDEFAVTVRDARDPERVDRLGDAIIAVLSRPFEIDGHVVRIGASVGTAIGPKDGRSVEALLRNADLALYRAKDDGRGLHRRFEPALLAQAERRRAIEAALREALDAGQFRLAYQPVVETEAGTIEGFEAQLRWLHPVMGEIAPADFLPIAEEARLASRIGEWMLRAACAEASSWPSPIRVSVNLSRGQLDDPHLCTLILSALSQSGLAPDRLEIDVSEEIFLRGHTGIAASLDALQRLGVRIALSDFGTGYAALGYVKKGRFSAIKIGDAFVKRIAAGDAESLAIVRAVSVMATTLGLAAVAEGAESDEERARVRELGFTLAQPNGQPLLDGESVRALVIEDVAVSSAA